jgi:hypothetical protein
MGPFGGKRFLSWGVQQLLVGKKKTFSIFPLSGGGKQYFIKSQKPTLTIVVKRFVENGKKLRIFEGNERTDLTRRENQLFFL